ncbi:hypothetical protein HDU96_007346 [Phlyctochytrium bullatum]|nr:hypothetical protein HDU96_007346 [Phlyctochytrium bullatum]
MRENGVPPVPVPPPISDAIPLSSESVGPSSSSSAPVSTVPALPEKSARALFYGINQNDTRQQRTEPLASSVDKDTTPGFNYFGKSKKPETSEEFVAPERGASMQWVAAVTASPTQAGVLSRVVTSCSVSDEMQARSRIATLSPAELGERLMRMGVGPGLVSALEESHINGANLLLLTDADLVAMGITEWYSRDLVLRMVANMVTSEMERVEQGLTASTSRLDRLPTYAP